MVLQRIPAFVSTKEKFVEFILLLSILVLGSAGNTRELCRNAQQPFRPGASTSEDLRLALPQKDLKKHIFLSSQVVVIVTHESLISIANRVQAPSRCSQRRSCSSLVPRRVSVLDCWFHCHTLRRLQWNPVPSALQINIHLYRGNNQGSGGVGGGGLGWERGCVSHHNVNGGGPWGGCDPTGLLELDWSRSAVPRI